MKYAVRIKNTELYLRQRCGRPPRYGTHCVIKNDVLEAVLYDDPESARMFRSWVMPIESGEIVLVDGTSIGVVPEPKAPLKKRIRSWLQGKT